MKRFILFASLLVCSPAFSQQPTDPGGFPFVPTEFGNYYECGIVSQQPRDYNERNPVYKITLAMTFAQNKRGEAIMVKPTNIEPVHVTVDGMIYNRTEQYVQPSYYLPLNQLDFTWSGLWKRDGNVTMQGRLFNSSTDRRWYYVETQARPGQTLSQTVSVCHPVQQE